jgi:hypothetical protein
LNLIFLVDNSFLFCYPYLNVNRKMHSYHYYLSLIYDLNADSFYPTSFSDGRLFPSEHLCCHLMVISMDITPLPIAEQVALILVQVLKMLSC